MAGLMSKDASELVINTMTGGLTQRNLIEVKKKMRTAIDESAPWDKFISTLGDISMMESELLNIHELYGTHLMDNLPYGYGNFTDFHVESGFSGNTRLREKNAESQYSQGIPMPLIKYFFRHVDGIIQLLLPATSSAELKPLILKQFFAMLAVRTETGEGHLASMAKGNSLYSVKEGQWMKIGVDGPKGLVWLPPITHEMKPYVIIETFKCERTVRGADQKMDVAMTAVSFIMSPSGISEEVDAVHAFASNIVTLRKKEKTSAIRKVLLNMIAQMVTLMTTPIRAVKDTFNVHSQAKKPRITYDFSSGGRFDPYV